MGTVSIAAMRLCMHLCHPNSLSVVKVKLQFDWSFSQSAPLKVCSWSPVSVRCEQRKGLIVDDMMKQL